MTLLHTLMRDLLIMDSIKFRMLRHYDLKVSFISYELNIGYHFYLAGRMFAFDLPHAPLYLFFAMIIRSKYQKSHVSKVGKGNYIINSIYMQRLKVRTRGRQNVLPICKGRHSMLTILQ